MILLAFGFGFVYPSFLFRVPNNLRIFVVGQLHLMSAWKVKEEHGIGEPHVGELISETNRNLHL